MHALLPRFGPLTLLFALACGHSPDAQAGTARDAGNSDPSTALRGGESTAARSIASGERGGDLDPAPIAVNERVDPASSAEDRSSGDPVATSAIEDDEPEQPAGFSFVITHDRTYVVLRTRTDASWGVGPLTLAMREGPMVIVRGVDSAALPEDAIEAATQRMVLRSGSDVVCVAELGAPQLLRRAYPHWEQNEIWNGEDGAPQASDAQVAREGWEIAVDSEVLVAEALVVSGDCGGAQWAHSERAPLDPGVEAAPIARSRIVRAFRRLDAHRDLQSAWPDAREYDDDPGAAQWDARRGADRTILTFESRGGRRFALVSALAHDGCGDFTGGLWGLFEQTPRGLVPVISQHSMQSPVALADVDGDSVPEVIFRDALVYQDGSSVDVTTPYFDCPC